MGATEKANGQDGTRLMSLFPTYFDLNVCFVLVSVTRGRFGCMSLKHVLLASLILDFANIADTTYVGALRTSRPVAIGGTSWTFHSRVSHVSDMFRTLRFLQYAKRSQS